MKILAAAHRHLSVSFQRFHEHAQATYALQATPATKKVPSNHKIRTSQKDRTLDSMFPVLNTSQMPNELVPDLGSQDEGTSRKTTKSRTDIPMSECYLMSVRQLREAIEAARHQRTITHSHNCLFTYHGACMQSSLRYFKTIFSLG